jgi:acetylcholinesterase
MVDHQSMTPTVTLRQGTFRGITTSNSIFPQILDVFLGIPYALPPTGERRFRPPVKVRASTDTNIAGWGPRAPGSGDDPTVPEGEDCLNLNVFRPSVWDQSKKLPVLVYIHGGSFNFGFAKASAIPSLVAWSPEPIIGISFNYRVGALGFLPSKIMAKEGCLNLGLKDQSLLLEWVQENVGAFGGDAENVTVMGSSAGAHSVSLGGGFLPSTSRMDCVLLDGSQAAFSSQI